MICLRKLRIRRQQGVGELAPVCAMLLVPEGAEDVLVVLEIVLLLVVISVLTDVLLIVILHV